MTTEKQHITTTERGADSFVVALRSWFTDRVGAACPVELTVSERPDAAGFSSQSVLFDASWDEDRARRSGSFVARMAPEPTAMVVFPRYAFCSTTTLRQHVDAQRTYYGWALADDGIRIPLIERAFDWLESRWPAEVDPTVLSWGDARIGNIMYQDFAPVAVFDWEMAAVGPRELDLGWFIFFHRFFQDLTPLAGVPGLSDFLRRAEVVATSNPQPAIRYVTWTSTWSTRRCGTRSSWRASSAG